VRTSSITNVRRRRSTREDCESLHARSLRTPDFQQRSIFPHSAELRTRTLSRPCTYCRMRLHSYAAIVSASPNCPQVECNELHHDCAYVIPAIPIARRDIPICVDEIIFCLRKEIFNKPFFSFHVYINNDELSRRFRYSAQM